jgi:glycosyltransferase involved in cell wall biosynthesis
VSVSTAYIAGTFPARSETFVFREVRALRAAGWPVATVTLHPPDERGVAEFSDLEAGTTCVYGSEANQTAKAAFVELLKHPIRGIGTMLTALLDAIHPGEKLSLGSRAKLPGQAFMAIGVARRLRGNNVRHIHAHFAHAPATIAMYAAQQLRVAFSFTGHANDLFQRRALLKRKLQRAAFVACISEWHRELYRGIVPGTVNKYPVIRCGVDVDSWTPRDHSDRAIPPEQAVKVLTVCRLVEKKGIDTLIRGLAKLNRPWRLTVAGDGPDRERLQSLAKETGCQDRIEWLGAVSNSVVSDLLKEADIFVLPCRQDSKGDRDGIPVVLIEAMAAGVPVISGDLPAIQELVQPGKTGVLIDGNRPEQLTTELQSLVEDMSRRGILAHAAREHVVNEFSLPTNISRLGRYIRGG